MIVPYPPSRDLLLDIPPMPRALIGAGLHAQVGVEARAMGMRRALVVTTGLRETGIVDEIVARLVEAGVDALVYDTAESNPKDTNVMALYADDSAEPCDGYVLIGGGGWLSTVFDAELAEDMRDVTLDRARADKQPRRDLGIAEALADEDRNLSPARRKGAGLGGVGDPGDRCPGLGRWRHREVPRNGPSRRELIADATPVSGRRFSALKRAATATSGNPGT